MYIQTPFHLIPIHQEKNSIDEEIGDIKIETHSILLEELKQDIFNGGGTLNEIGNIKHFVFYNSWNNRVILEILAEQIYLNKLNLYDIA